MRSVFLYFVIIASAEISGFCPCQSLSVPHSCSSNSIFRGSSSIRETRVVVEETSPTQVVQATLTFNCERIFESEPFPASSPDEIYKFFQLTSSRNCMVSAGNTREVEETQTTMGLLREWKERTEPLGGVSPEMGDAVMNVATGSMKFPGLVVSSCAVIGSKLLEPPPSGGYPEYEFTLIKDERTVRGLAPTVWIFNKITGHNAAAAAEEGESSSSSAAPLSLSRVTAEPTEDGQTIFKFPVKFTIEIKFPPLLLKILPFSKEKTEEEGSKAIALTLEKDISKVMVELRKQYLEYCANSP